MGLHLGVLDEIEPDVKTQVSVRGTTILCTLRYKKTSDKAIYSKVEEMMGRMEAACRQNTN